MQAVLQAAVAQQVDRICDSPGFRAAPRLAALFRVLAENLVLIGETKMDQRSLAARAFGLQGDFNPATNPLVRVQMTRLRKALAAYYERDGGLDPIVLEIPKRSYCLRVSPRGRWSQIANYRAVERARLVVLDFVDRGLPADQIGTLQEVTHALLVELGRFHSVTVIGHIPRPRVTDPSQTAHQVTSSYPLSFVLDGSISHAPDGMVLDARPIDGDTGAQVWARSYPLNGPHAARRSCVSRLAQELADETGAIAFEILRAAAGKPIDQISVHEAISAVWRFWITGLVAYLTYAVQILEYVVSQVPNSGLALAYLATIRCEEYVGSETKVMPLPDEVLNLFERARSLAPADPWVEVLRCFAQIFACKTTGVGSLLESLEARPSSGAFTGMLAACHFCLGSDLTHARRLYARSLAETPHPPYWYRLHMAIIDLALGDAGAASTLLDEIPNRVDPAVQIVRAAVACQLGTLDAAKQFADETVAACPAYPRYGEIMLRRHLPERVVDTIAMAVQPLALEWFQDPPSEVLA